MALTYDQIEEGKVYIRNGKKIFIVNKHLTEHCVVDEHCFGNFIFEHYSQGIVYYYLDNPITQITCPFEMREIFGVPEARAPPPLMGLLPKMEVYNKHFPTIICSEDGNIKKVIFPDDPHTPHILSIDMGNGTLVDIPTYNKIIINNFYNSPTKQSSLEFLKISEIIGLEGSFEEQISKILEHFPDRIIII